MNAKLSTIPTFIGMTPCGYSDPYFKKLCSTAQQDKYFAMMHNRFHEELDELCVKVTDIKMIGLWEAIPNVYLY